MLSLCIYFFLVLFWFTKPDNGLLKLECFDIYSKNIYFTFSAQRTFGIGLLAAVEAIAAIWTHTLHTLAQFCLHTSSDRSPACWASDGSRNCQSDQQTSCQTRNTSQSACIHRSRPTSFRCLGGSPVRPKTRCRTASPTWVFWTVFHTRCRNSPPTLVGALALDFAEHYNCELRSSGIKII